jgi:hypothetical protein
VTDQIAPVKILLVKNSLKVSFEYLCFKDVEVDDRTNWKAQRPDTVFFVKSLVSVLKTWRSCECYLHRKDPLGGRE